MYIHSFIYISVLSRTSFSYTYIDCGAAQTKRKRKHLNHGELNIFLILLIPPFHSIFTCMLKHTAPSSRNVSTIYIIDHHMVLRRRLNIDGLGSRVSLGMTACFLCRIVFECGLERKDGEKKTIKIRITQTCMLTVCATAIYLHVTDFVTNRFTTTTVC